MEERNYSLYIHTNKVNGKRYVGITSTTPQFRWGKNGYGYRKNQHFYAAIQKYGWDTFDHEIRLTDLTHEEAKKREKFYIALFRSYDPNFGYNQSHGGESANFGKHSGTREYNKAMYEKHKDRAKAQMKEYRNKHREELKEKSHKYYLEHKEKFIQYTQEHSKEWCDKHKEEQKEKRHKYYLEHIDRYKELAKKKREKRHKLQINDQ